MGKNILIVGLVIVALAAIGFSTAYYMQNKKLKATLPTPPEATAEPGKG